MRATKLKIEVGVALLILVERLYKSAPGNMVQQKANIVNTTRSRLQRVITSREKETTLRHGASEPEGGGGGGRGRGEILLPHLLDNQRVPGRIRPHRFRQLLHRLHGRRETRATISLGYG